MQCQDETRGSRARRRPTSARLLDAGKAQPRDIAILCRTNEQPRSFETELRRANVPYVLIGGMSFFDRKEVRDILSYLKVIDNPHDEPSLLRIINQPPRGIGNAAQKRLLDEATSHGKFLWDVLPDALVDRRRRRQNGRRGRRVSRGSSTSFAVSRRKAQRSPKLVAQVIDKTAYRDSLAKLYPDPAERESRLGVARRNHQRGRQLRQEAPVARSAEPVRLPRRHAAQRARRQRRKGIAARPQRGRPDDAPQREGPGVSARLPRRHGRRHSAAQAVARSENDAAIDEERRLCYVGVTRARERLTLSFALTRRKWGKPRKTIPSRFLYEMTGQADNFALPANEGPSRRRQEAQVARRKTPSSKRRPPRKTASTLALTAGAS